MDIENVGGFVGVVLAGSLIMERFVAIAKTFFPQFFGEAGPRPEAIYDDDESLRRQEVGVFGTKRFSWLVTEHRRARRRRVQLLVLGTSGVTAWLVATDGWVSYGPDDAKQRVYWLLFALLISGGSAFWTQMVGVAGAIKDLRAEQRSQLSEPRIIVVDKNDRGMLQAKLVRRSAATGMREETSPEPEVMIGPEGGG